jgi:transposase InsO family protein
MTGWYFITAEWPKWIGLGGSTVFSWAGCHTYLVQQYTELYMDQIVRLHGIPKTIISDRGTQFVARFWEELHECLGTKLIRSSSYHPQTDGQTER